MAPTQDVVGHTVCMGMHVFMLEHSVYWSGHNSLVQFNSAQSVYWRGHDGSVQSSQHTGQATPLQFSSVSLLATTVSDQFSQFTGRVTIE